MKKIYLIALVGLIVACGTSQKLILDETAKIQFVKPFYKFIYPGQEDGIKSVVLILPYENNVADCAVDSVYFMGHHTALKADKRSGHLIYQTKIDLKADHVAIIPPFDIEEKQALISYVDSEEKKHYYIIKNIAEEEPVFMP